MKHYEQCNSFDISKHWIHYEQIFQKHIEISTKIHVDNSEENKIKFKVASGLPIVNGDDRHVKEIASMALALRKEVALVSTGSVAKKHFRLRAGFASGEVMSSYFSLHAAIKLSITQKRN